MLEEIFMNSEKEASSELTAFCEAKFSSKGFSYEAMETESIIKRTPSRKYNNGASLIEKGRQDVLSPKPIYNKMYPQLSLPKDLTWKLSRISGDSWILNPTEEELSPKIPEGKLSYVVLQEDPTNILCFEHNAVMESPELRSRVDGPINFGHSSLANKENYLDIFDSNISTAKRLAEATKPVLLAGHLNFVDEESPLLGAGQMTSWTVESGHYRPSVTEAKTNRLGPVERILPWEYFHDVV